MERCSREKIFMEVINKILIYSSEKNTNHVKLVKYLTVVRQQQLNLNGVIEKKLRKSGVVESLMLFLSRQVDSSTKSSPANLTEHIRLSLTFALSIIGNAFRVDYQSRRQAEKIKFVMTLKHFLQSTTMTSNADIVSRVLKCLANLAVSDQLRSFVLREGIGICIVNRLEEVYLKLTNVMQTDDNKIDEVIIEKNEESIVCQGARALRIFSQNFEFQQHLIRFGAIMTLGKFLNFSHNQILFSDILKALAVLTSSMKKIPRDVMEALTEITTTQKSVPQLIIAILQSHSSIKCLAEPATICLTQLACNTVLAKTLVTSNVFEVTLQAIQQTNDVDRLEKLLRLLVNLTQENTSTMDCNLAHRLRLSCCSQLGETLKFLQMPELKQYHSWILKLYENLYEDKLKDLISRGIIQVLDEYLRDKIGDYSFDNLTKKLAARDDDSCHVHAKKDSKCPFSPKYRCTSPTYQLVQDIEKRRSIEVPNGLSQLEFNNSLSSPYSSPPHSPSDYAERYTYFGTYSPSTSPSYSRQFQFSPESSSGSEDEGIGSSHTISPYQSPTTTGSLAPPEDDCEHTEYSEDECEADVGGIKMEIENDFEPPKKRTKHDEITEIQTSISCNNPGANTTTTDDMIMNIDKEEDDVTNNQELIKSEEENMLVKTDNLSLDQIRHRYSKIVSILGILNRCAHFTNIPPDLTKFLPFLFEVIWSTRISVEKAEDNSKALEHVDESLGSLCFQRSFRIVTKICSDITTFPNLVENGVIPLVYRILLYNFQVVRESEESPIIIHNRPQQHPNHRLYHPQHSSHNHHQTTVTEFVKDYGLKLMDTLIGMSGSENVSNGWRHYYFLRWLIPGQRQSAGNSYVNAILSIPLLYREKSLIYREFEEKTGNWEKIFELLTNVDDMPFSQFQNCILALMCIGQTKKLVWSDAEEASKRKLLYPVSSTFTENTLAVTATEDDPSNSDQIVVCELDDGSTMTLEKKLLEISPVFERMLNGHFREATCQRVHLRHTSRSALSALATQIYQQRLEEKTIHHSESDNGGSSTFVQDNNQMTTPLEKKVYLNYDLSTLFELLSLCDQFLLDDLYERTLNTLIGYYICPYSVPTIYAESMTLGGLHKCDAQLSTSKNLNLTRLALKYLLVGEDICLTLRSGAFLKIFDMTLPAVVVQDLRAILSIKM